LNYKESRKPLRTTFNPLPPTFSSPGKMQNLNCCLYKRAVLLEREKKEKGVGEKTQKGVSVCGL